jgi:hypothetical protein
MDWFLKQGNRIKVIAYIIVSSSKQGILESGPDIMPSHQYRILGKIKYSVVNAANIKFAL